MNNKKIIRVIAIICGVLGLGLLSYVLLPLVAYEVTSPRFATYLSPIPEDALAAMQPTPDYTKASNWFEGVDTKNFDNSNIFYYTISIPKLGIKKATVAIGGEDLEENLIQYPGTATPGRPGNAVIFGHSILPQFFNPKEYISIFSTLPTVQKGDEIQIEYDGVSFLYRIEDKFEVKPTDLQILEQNPSDAFLTLVTCTPPGHPLRPKRLIVRARIVPLEGKSS